MNIGKLGENLAKEYLVKNNFNIIETNYHSRYGEIDIICEDCEHIIFVEVKSKLYSSYSNLSERVNISKQNKILKTILLYLSENNIKKQPRIDVIEVTIFPKSYKINHIENAFEMRNYEFF